MKRFVILLAIVCTVFICCGATASAYSKGDVVNGITLASDFSECSNYIVLKDTLYLLNSTDLYVDTTRNNRIMSNTVGLWRIETDGTCGSVTSFNTFWFYKDDISSSSFGIYDDSGSLVFPLPPEPSPIPVYGTLTEALKSEFPVLLHMILVIVIVLILGGIMITVSKPLLSFLKSRFLMLFRN